jgi:hypothetical protein
MLYTPFSVGVAHELGELSLCETVAKLQAFGPPGTVRLRSAGGRSLAHIETPLLTLLEHASYVDRLLDVAALVDAVTPRFLEVTLRTITTALQGPRITSSLLQAALTYAPLIRDPPGTYLELVEQCPRTIRLNPTLRPAAVDGEGGALPYGLRATRIGDGIHLMCPHDRMPRGIVRLDGSAVFTKVGAMLRGPLQRLGQLHTLHAGPLPAAPMSLGWSLTLGSVPADVRERLVALRTIRGGVFAPLSPPTPIPESSQAKRRRDAEAHLQLVDALWRGDLQCAVLLLEEGAPAMPPANLPPSLRAHLDGPQGPAVALALQRAPSLLPRLLDKGLVMPLESAALWVLARPQDLRFFQDRLDEAFLVAVLEACDANPHASTAVLGPLCTAVPPQPQHLECVRRRGDVMHLLIRNVRLERDECLRLMGQTQSAAVVAALLDALDLDTEVLYALFQHPAFPHLVRLRPAILERVTDEILEDCLRARWIPAFRCLLRHATPALVDLAIEVESPDALACLLERGGVVTVGHVVTVVEASEHRLHPVFWTLLRSVSTETLQEALAESSVPIFLACDALRGLRRQRPPVPLPEVRWLLECLRDAGAYIPTVSHAQRLSCLPPMDVARLLHHLVVVPEL